MLGMVGVQEGKGRDFPGDSVAKKTPHSLCRRPGFDPQSGNYIPHVATKNSHATAKDLAQPNKEISFLN